MVSIVLLLAAINNTSVAVAFPEIMSSFNVSVILAGWVMSAYMIAIMATIPISGKISDVLGRKLTFIIFLSLFTIGSLLCSIAPNVESLIAFRILQGLGGSGFLPSASGIVADEFPKSRQKAIGFFTTVYPIGNVIGPNLGGWMITALGWRSIFWINIPLCIIALVASIFLMSAGRKEKSHIDVIGAGLLAIAIVTLMISLSEIGNADRITPWLLMVILIGISTASLLLFWRRQTRIDYPIVEPEILREKPFLAANIYNFVCGCNYGTISLVPLYAVSIYGLSTLESGFILTPRSVVMIAVSAVTSLSLVRWGYRWPLLAGTTIMIPGFIILALEPASFTISGTTFNSIVFLSIIMGLAGLSVGTAVPAASNASIELMPDKVGTIAGIRQMFLQAGSIFSITVGSLLLHNAGIAGGFQILFFGLSALILLVMIPAIFVMPKSPLQLREAEGHLE